MPSSPPKTLEQKEQALIDLVGEVLEERKAACERAVENAVSEAHENVNKARHAAAQLEAIGRQMGALEQELGAPVTVSELEGLLSDPTQAKQRVGRIKETRGKLDALGEQRKALEEKLESLLGDYALERASLYQQIRVGEATRPQTEAVARLVEEAAEPLSRLARSVERRVELAVDNVGSGARARV